MTAAEQGSGAERHLDAALLVGTLTCLGMIVGSSLGATLFLGYTGTLIGLTLGLLLARVLGWLTLGRVTLGRLLLLTTVVTPIMWLWSEAK